ncbi:hypothetical protein MA16_Dca001568 [Dendrobium catenatum]|uniref:Uncharacterized protein n=1 Tax=Dendrobium catenatum TaxID=906689 RepID=A0A2I0WMR8_9ASPA|nr:hypothetical protein MA16_Dca001568 [Dendrobium catenatum]
MEQELLLEQLLLLLHQSLIHKALAPDEIKYGKRHMYRRLVDYQVHQDKLIGIYFE